MIAEAVIRVLIVGNSLTAANDLPRMIETIARASGIEVQCAAIALPDYGLQEHWEDGRALKAIRQGGWTHVVLQQGPTSLPESREILLTYARRFAPEIRASGAELIFYGVWPPRSRLAAMDAVTGSYRDAAEATKGRLVAAGDAWQRAWREDPALPFFGADNFHPSPLGTYVAALMLTEAVTGRRPVRTSLPFLKSLSDEQISVIHRAASSAFEQKRHP